MKVATLTLCLLLLAAGAHAESGFEGLLTRVPRGANLLMMVNAEEVLASPMATAGGWGQSFEKNYAAAPLMLPPSAKRFVMGSRLELATMTPEWEAAATLLKQDLPMGAVARLVHGQQEEIGGAPAVASPRGGYVLKFGDAEFGMMRPADRQRTARWVSAATAASAPSLSPYLAKAASYPIDAGTEIVLALDLKDALGANSIRAAMDASPVVSAANVSPATVAQVLAGMEGMTLGVKVSDDAYGSLRVDFSSSIEAIAPIAKDLLIEALGEAGLMIDEFADWKLQTGADTFRISGKFTPGGLRRVFGLLELDASAIGEPGAEGDAGNSDNGAAGGNKVDPYVTQQYYKSVKDYLHDLKMETGAKSYYTIARWFERYADRIDRLPILQVDPELLDYSAQTVQLLRDCGAAIRGGGIKAAGRSAGVQGSSSTSYDTYSYSVFSGSVYSPYQQGQDAVRDAEAQRRAIRGQERAQSSADVRKIVGDIQAETSRIRRVMTEKHGIEF